jgi:hypothetical protein
MGFRGAVLRGLLGGGFAAASLRGLAPEAPPPGPVLLSTGLSFRVRDGAARSTQLQAFLSVAADDTMGAVTGALQAWALALDHVTGGVIEELLLRVPVPAPHGLKTEARSGSPLASSLILNFANSQDRAAYAFTILGVDVGVISRGGPDMTTGASIDRLAALMASGLTGTTGGAFTTDRAGPLTAALRGRLDVRLDRGQLKRSSLRRIG